MVTRSVEIPDAAVVAAANAALDAGFVDPDDGTIPQWYGEDPIPVWTHPSEAVKVILAAALPYLAPAGDGGLREALEHLAGDYEYIPSFRIEELLAAHPPRLPYHNQ